MSIGKLLQGLGEAYSSYNDQQQQAQQLQLKKLDLLKGALEYKGMQSQMQRDQTAAQMEMAQLAAENNEGQEPPSPYGVNPMGGAGAPQGMPMGGAGAGAAPQSRPGGPGGPGGMQGIVLPGGAGAPPGSAPPGSALSGPLPGASSGGGQRQSGGQGPLGPIPPGGYSLSGTVRALKQKYPNADPQAIMQAAGQIASLHNADSQFALKQYQITQGLQEKYTALQDHMEEALARIQEATTLREATEAAEDARSQAGKWTLMFGPDGKPIRVNTATGETSVVNAPAGSTKSGTGAVPEDAVDADAKKIAAYEMPPLVGAGRNGQNFRVMAKVYESNPDYDGTKYATKAKTMVDFLGGGKDATLVRNISSASGHLDTLTELGRALKNGDTPAINVVRQKIAAWSGGAAPASFDAAKQLVAGEIAKAVSAGALADRQELQAGLSNASSWQQLTGVIGAYKALLATQQSRLNQQFENSTGRDLPSDAPTDAANSNDGWSNFRVK